MELGEGLKINGRISEFPQFMDIYLFNTNHARVSSEKYLSGNILVDVCSATPDHIDNWTIFVVTYYSRVGTCVRRYIPTR